MKSERSTISVTVAIPVRNEERTLARCLERLSRFAEVVVIDSGSTDATRLIAETFGARVVNFSWNGRYPKKRNWYLQNHPPRCPWVLFLDADECVNDAFCNEIEVATMQDEIDGFWLNYQNYFLGRQLRHGVPQRKLALFKVGKALYERINEDSWSKLDMEIHEHPIVEGRTSEIRTPIEHRDYNSLPHFLEKHLEYAKWEAKRFFSLSTTLGAWESLTPRQKFKYNHIAKWWYPHCYFLYSYIVKFGFLDGSTGYYYSAYKTWYFRTIRLLIQEQTINQNGENADPPR